MPSPVLLRGRSVNLVAGRSSLLDRLGLADAAVSTLEDLPEAVRVLAAVLCAPRLVLRVDVEQGGLLEHAWILGLDAFHVHVRPVSVDVLEINLVDPADTVQRLVGEVPTRFPADGPLQVRTVGKRLTDMVLADDLGRNPVVALTARGRETPATSGFVSAYRERERAVQVVAHRVDGTTITGSKLAWIESSAHGVWTCPPFSAPPPPDVPVVLQQSSSQALREELLSVLDGPGR